MNNNVSSIFNSILSPGPIVFMPVIIIIFVFILKLFSKESTTWIEGVRSAITLGIAFVAMFIVIGFMLTTFEAPFKSIRKVFNFDTVDLGWSPMAALAWAWQWAFLLFPIQIGVNALMLRLRWTKTLNADLWNVWNKVLTALVMTYFLSMAISTVGAVTISMFTAVIWIALELKNGDVMYERQKSLTKIPGVVSPHSLFFAASMIFFIDKFLRKFTLFQDSNVKEKIIKEGQFMLIMRDNMFIGFFLGLVLCLTTVWFDIGAWATYVQLPFSIAAALVLFPMVSKLFTKSLVPLGMSIQNIMTQRFNNRELYIGLDWPFLAGNSKLWIAATALIPFEIAFAIIMSYIPSIHMLFPLASLINVCLAPVLLVMCNGNLKRMIASGVVVVPVYLFFGGVAAPAMTAIAKENISSLPQSAQDAINDGLLISNSGFEAPLLRTGLSVGVYFMTGHITVITSIGLAALGLWITLFTLYYKEMKKINKDLKDKRLEKSLEPNLPEPKPVGYYLFKRVFKR